MLKTAANYRQGPVVVRYPRGAGAGCEMDEELREIEIGKAEIAREGEHGLILTLGPVFWEAMDATQALDKAGLSLTVVNMRSLKPLDKDTLRELGQQFAYIMTIEEGAVAGGFGSAVHEAFSEMDIPEPHIKSIGIPDCFIEQGDRSILLEKVGLDAKSIASVALQFFEPTLQKKITLTDQVDAAKSDDVRHHREHSDEEHLGGPARLS
jgi:1-deoxy-D-xylulose-5-phosphate synthase